MGNGQRWLDVSAGWALNDLLSNALQDVWTGEDPKTTAEAWQALKTGQMPRKVLNHWLHGYSVERQPSRDHGAFAAVDGDGAGWDMPACSHYAGAALVLPEQIGGDFDAHVQFMCSHFSAGVALELAAYAVGPQSVMGTRSYPKCSGPKMDMAWCLMCTAHRLM